MALTSTAARSLAESRGRLLVAFATTEPSNTSTGPRCQIWKPGHSSGMKQFLLLSLLLPWLCACDRLSDAEVKAIKCELWRENGGALNHQIYRDLAGKTKCITTNNSGEMLTIKGSKGIPIQCDLKEQKSFLQEVNSICDALLSQKASN